jgi:uncharacterized membrane protein
MADGHGWGDVDHGSTRKRGTSNEQDYGEANTPFNLSVDADDDLRERGPIHHQQEESHLRSLAKGITWRFVATMTTVIIAWLVTGETSIAFQIGFFEFFAKVGIYYIHERIWARIRI